LTRLALAALPGFVARKNGLLINISSVVALVPELLNGTYSGSKAYVVNFTQALKNEVEGKGVTVQAVLPGAPATSLWEMAGRPVENSPSDIADWEKYETARKAVGPNLSRQKPAARYGIQS
jgi:short-subunit dehydrogenase